MNCHVIISSSMISRYFSSELSACEFEPERRGFSPAVMDGGEEFSGKSAYEVLGVSESCSGAEIKASFRRLAKETHPDVLASPDDSTFLEILAAYEVIRLVNHQILNLIF